MDSRHRAYRSFLLRIWSASSETGAIWRASLEEVTTHQRYTFGTFVALSAFLQQQMLEIELEPPSASPASIAPAQDATTGQLT